MLVSFNFDLTLDIPSNINSMTLQELVKWAGPRIKGTANFQPYNIANILNNIYRRMGLVLDNEQMLFLLDDSKRLLCEASAGSGKTTVSQLKMIKYKMLYGYSGSDILAIAYNDHAAEDMQKRHSSLIETIMSQRIEGVKLDDRIVCRTFHSNALAWVTEFANKCGVTNKATMIISQLNEEKFMEKALNSVFQKKYVDENGNQTETIKPTMCPALISFNSYMEEKMLPATEWVGHPKFEEIELPVEVVEEVIMKFNKLCTFNSSFTFSNILVKFYNLLKDNEDIRKRIQMAYKVLLVDEYQDMSPLMNEIISLMINEDTVFNAIGDGDQSIYSFKGTDSLNCLKFKQYFPQGKVVSMGANRRCRKNIVDVASNILSINKLRYPKELHSVKDGGSILTVPYESTVDECNYIISKLKEIPTNELYDVCIAYRNKESSLLLSKMLLDARIPFVVKSGYEPMKDLLSASLYEIFGLLNQPTSKAYQLSVLYKLVPANRKQCASVIGENDGSQKHYLDYDWSKLGNLGNSVMKCLTTLKECEESVKAGAPMSNYFNKLFHLFKLYYWNWVKEQKRFPDDLENSIVSDYSSELSYKQFVKNLHDLADMRDRFSSSGVGLTMTTFHGLKGLEFKTVFLVDLDNNIFPNYKKIEQDCDGNIEAELDMKEECVRLFYVACTRPKDELIVMYNKNNPSIYIDLLVQKTVRAKQEAEVEIKETIQSEEDSMLDGMFDLFEDTVEEDLADSVGFDLFSDSVEDTISLDDDDIISSFEVPDVVNTEPVAFDLTNFEVGVETPVKVESKYPIADHKMYMYHEPSDSYYVIEKGEKLYEGSSIDFEASVEVSKEEYDKGMKEQVEYDLAIEEKIRKVKEEESKEVKSKLEGTLGIFDFLNS